MILVLLLLASVTAFPTTELSRTLDKTATNSNTNWRDSCPTNKDKANYMLRNNLHTDCGFVVGEGEGKRIFRAHKFVLSLVSSVFEDIFYGDEGQDTDNIRIPGVDPDVFQTFLNAIYLEEVAPNSFKEACSLLELSSKYTIKWMTDQCLSYMASNISPSNAATGFQVLSLNGQTDLASSFWKVIQEETTQVLNSEDFTDLGKETLVRILEEDKLAVESEREVLSAVERWVDADLQRKGLTQETDRLALLSEFLPYIRFVSMSVEEFMSFPARKTIFSWDDNDSIINKILDPDSPASLPPNVCSKKRVFLPNKKTHPATTSSPATAETSARQKTHPATTSSPATAETSARQKTHPATTSSPATEETSTRQKTHPAPTSSPATAGTSARQKTHPATTSSPATEETSTRQGTLSAPTNSPIPAGSSTTQVPLPGDWKGQLVSAARDGDVGALRRLQAAGADLSVRYGWGYTLLHSAAVGGRAECVQWLLEQGLSPHSTTGGAWTAGGWTPLHEAAWNGRLETVRLLLDSGADPAARDSADRTALDIAISNRHSAVADLLRRRT